MTSRPGQIYYGGVSAAKVILSTVLLWLLATGLYAYCGAVRNGIQQTAQCERGITPITLHRCLTLSLTPVPTRGRRVYGRQSKVQSSFRQQSAGK